MSGDDSKRLVGAPIIMKARGEQTDLDIYDYVRDNVGCTVRDISNTLEMTRGRVDGSINRLVESGLVDVKYFRRNNILIKRIEPAGLQDRPFDQIVFPSALLDASLWNDKAFACAVSRSSIKIFPEIRSEYKDQCVFSDELFFQKLDGDFCFKFTDDFINFYEMPNSELDVSGFKDEILVTVGSTIIPVDAPYDYWKSPEKAVLSGRIAASLNYVIYLDHHDDEPVTAQSIPIEDLFTKKFQQSTSQVIEVEADD